MQDQLNKKFSSFADSKNYKGYLQSEEHKIDNVLAHIGPGSPCGEFFRRYWHPVALSSEIGENPKELKILGENLVIFRTKIYFIGLINHKSIQYNSFLKQNVIVSSVNDFNSQIK